MPPRDSAISDTRSLPHWLRLAAAVSLAARIVLFVVEKPPVESAERPGGGSPAANAPDLVHWIEPAAAVALAEQSGRPILYDFAADWCGPCKTMRAEIFSDAAEAAFIDSAFVPVRVIDRAREEGKNPEQVEALQKKYEIRAFPTLVVAAKGLPPVTLQGYSGRRETLRQLHAAAARSMHGP